MSSGVRLPRLCELAYARSFTMWHYDGQPDQKLNELTSRNFFGAAGGLLKPGDFILLTGCDGGRIVIVSSSHEGAVAVAQLT